jgi:hypothetical protein
VAQQQRHAGDIPRVQKRFFGVLAVSHTSTPQRSPPDGGDKRCPPLAMVRQAVAEFPSGGNEAKPTTATAVDRGCEASGVGISIGLPNFRGGSVSQGSGGGATASRERAAGQQSEGTAPIAVEVAVGLAAVFGSTTVEPPQRHAEATPVRQKRFFGDLSPPEFSQPDREDRPCFPLAREEGLGQRTMAEVFSGSSEARFPAATAVELGGEAGDDGKSSGLPNIRDGSVGQGVGGGATATGEAAEVQDDGDGDGGTADEATAAIPAGKSQGLRTQPSNWQLMTRTQQRNWLHTQAKIRKREKEQGQTS